MTAGFLGIFAAVGPPIVFGAGLVADAVPWAGLAIGLLLAATGLLVLSGSGSSWESAAPFDSVAAVGSGRCSSSAWATGSPRPAAPSRSSVANLWDRDTAVSRWAAGARDLGIEPFGPVVYDAFLLFAPEAGWGSAPSHLVAVERLLS